MGRQKQLSVCVEFTLINIDIFICFICSLSLSQSILGQEKYKNETIREKYTKTNM